MPSLNLGEAYAIGIRTKMASNIMRESDISWIDSIKAPECLPWYDNNTEVCAPYAPENLSIQEVKVNDLAKFVNVTWNTTLPNPNYYILEMFQLSMYRSTPPVRFNLTGNQNFHLIQIPKVNESLFQVTLRAVSRGGSTSVISPPFHIDQIVHIRSEKHTFTIIAIIVVTIFILIVVVSFFLNNSHIVPDEENLVKDPTLFIRYSSKFDEMEIGLSDIDIDEEELGAGAFGIVKKCYIRCEDSIQPAAAKMLKRKENTIF